MKIFTQNSKIKATGIANNVDLYNFGIPAFMSADGTKTCPNAGACAAGCYARSGAYLFKGTKNAYESRLTLTKDTNFVATIGAELSRLLVKAQKSKRRLVIRIHDSGDFYSPHYQLSWYHIAKAFPEVLFYAYTKQVAQSVALSSRQPLNMTLIYSYGGKQDSLIRAQDRHSKVFQTEAEMLSAGYADTTENDLNAIGENPKIGLVYHGTKRYDNTQWSKVTTPKTQTVNSEVR